MVSYENGNGWTFTGANGGAREMTRGVDDIRRRAARPLIVAVLLVFALTGTAPADTFRGTIAYEQGDFAAALAEFKPAADAGDRFAQYKLGRMYENGEGVEKSYEKALEWYETAAKNAHKGALSSLGRMHLRGLGVKVNAIEAYKWFNIAQTYGDGLSARYMRAMRPKMTRDQVDAAQKLAIKWIGENVARQ